MDGDCVCLSLNATRSEAAIVDPSRIRINDVFETVISARSFLNAVMFSKSDKKEELGIHGGFDIT